jgi:hypothetical protein
MTDLAAPFFGLGQAVLALGLGWAGLSMPRLLPLPAYGRLAFGVAATPFVTATLLLALTLVAPGLPLAWHVVAPGALGLALLLALHRRGTSCLQMIRRIDLRAPVLWASIVATAIVMAVLAPRVGYYLTQPIGNSDALQYLAQARHLLLHRSFFMIAGIEGLADATLRGDAHGPLWIAYNAAALAWSGFAGTDPGAQAAPRLAFLLSMLACLAGGVAVASAARMRGLALLVVLLILVVPQFPGVVIGGDRDAFRLTALLLLCAFLAAQATSRLRRLGFAVALLGAVLGTWAMQGHALSLVLVPVTVASWCLCMLARGEASRVRTLILTSAVAAGFCLGALHVGIAYYRTGSLSGDNVDSAKVMAGTVYALGHAAREEARIGEGALLVSRLRISIERDGGWPSLAAILLAAVLTLRLGARSLAGQSQARSLHRSGEMTGGLFAVWFLGQSLLLLGLFDTASYRLSDWTVLNARYAMQWYLFAALLVAWGLAAAASLLSNRLREARRGAMAAALLPATLLLTSTASAAILAKRWLYFPTSAYVAVSSKLNAIVAALPPSCRAVSEDTGLGFHADRPVLQLYSKHLRELVQETDTEALLRKLDDRHICAVVLYNGLYVDTAGPGTPFAKLLNSPAFQLQDAAPWRIYVRTGLQRTQ